MLGRVEIEVSDGSGVFRVGVVVGLGVGVVVGFTLVVVWWGRHSGGWPCTSL